MSERGSVIRVVRKDGVENLGSLRKELWFGERPPALVLGFVSPHLDFAAVVKGVRAQIPAPIPVVLTTTAGELCTLPDKSSPYLSAEGAWKSLVFQAFSPDLLVAVHVQSIALPNEDLKAGKPSMDLEARVHTISQRMTQMTIPFPINPRDVFGYTIVDGVSLSENAFMEAVYRSQKFPCFMFGGSAGGLLDFKQTLIYDGQKTVQNAAVMTLAKVAQPYRFSVFRSQNFEPAGPSLVVLSGETALRRVTHVLDEDTLDSVPILPALAKALGCSLSEIPTKMAQMAFGVQINGHYYIRSVANINMAAGEITFYCDVEAGDRLFLLKKKDFLATTRNDWQSYLKGKTAPIGGVLSDCILRRLNNANSLSGLEIFQEIPVAGFSTFGELLGVNVNETLTALMFHEVLPGQTFDDPILDNFAPIYASFQTAFLQRRNTRDRILDALHQQILGQLMRGIPLVKDLMNSYNAIRERLDRNGEQLNSVLESLTNFTDSIGINTEANAKIYDQVKALSDNLMAINTISETVDDIAQQTGVLSINASIQAARAGNAGRAFAVVAGEVRKLSVETQGHVQAITKTADNIVASVSGILEGAQSASQYLGAMVSSNSEIHHRAQDISEQVTLTVEQMEEGRAAIRQIEAYLSDIDRRQSMLQVISRNS